MCVVNVYLLEVCCCLHGANGLHHGSSHNNAVNAKESARGDREGKTREREREARGRERVGERVGEREKERREGEACSAHTHTPYIRARVHLCHFTQLFEVLRL